MASRLLIKSNAGTTEFGGEPFAVPLVKEGVKWTTERQGSPGKLEFTIFGGPSVWFNEGAPVHFQVDGKKVFYGFLFTMKQSGDGEIQCVAYDQLRYMKNKATVTYTNKSLRQVVKLLIDGTNGLNTSGLSSGIGTGSYAQSVLGYETTSESNMKLMQYDNAIRTQGNPGAGSVYALTRIEEEETMFDIVQNAVDMTLMQSGNLYVMFDNYGQVTVRNIADMKVKASDGRYWAIRGENLEGYEFSSSIDDETYTQVRLHYENKESGSSSAKTSYVYSGVSIGGLRQYGPLIYDEDVSTASGVGNANKGKIGALLRLYAQPKKQIVLKGVQGNHNVRAGSLVYVQFNPDQSEEPGNRINGWMLVEKCVHTYEQQHHTMDLTLRGGIYTDA